MRNLHLTPKKKLAVRLRVGPQRRELNNFIEAIDDPESDSLFQIHD